MIVIYPDSKYSKGIAKVTKDLIPDLLFHYHSLEECKDHLNEDTKLILDFSYLSDNIDKDINYADPEEISKLYSIIDKVDKEVIPLVKYELLYWMILPDSSMNMSRYISSSIISNLNLFHQAKFKEMPDGYYQRNENRFVGYKFDIFNSKMIQEIKRNSL